MTSGLCGNFNSLTFLFTSPYPHSPPTPHPPHRHTGDSATFFFSVSHKSSFLWSDPFARHYPITLMFVSCEKTMTMHYAKMLYVIGAFIGIWNLSLGNTDPLPTQTPRTCGPLCPWSPWSACSLSPVEPLESMLTGPPGAPGVHVHRLPCKGHRLC